MISCFLTFELKVSLRLNGKDCSDVFFSSSYIFQHYFRNSFRVSNSLDPDQVQHYFRPYLGSNCLQKLNRHKHSVLTGKELKSEG